MAKKTALENYRQIKEFRADLFSKLLSKKITIEEFANASYMFLLQNKIRPVAKAHDHYAVLCNYYYWLILIERRAATERRLMSQGLGSEQTFRELTDVYAKRRDQMVRRLLWELNLPFKKAYVVFRDVVEIEMESGEILYSTNDSLEKIKINISNIGLSKMPYYLPILDISF